MLTLSPYLAAYIGIGLVLAHLLFSRGGARDFRDAFRTKAGREPGWIACTVAVMAMTLAWPLLLIAAAVRRAVRQ